MKNYWLCFRAFWQETLHRQFRLTAILFCAVAAVGFFVCQRNPQLMERLMNLIRSVLDLVPAEELQSSESSVSPFTEMAAYFFNNAYSLFSSLLWSLVPFLNLAALSLCANALLLGGFSSYSLQSGIPPKTVLLGTLPHGIFEFAAIALTCSAGLYLCGVVSDRIRHKEGTDALPDAFKNCLSTFWCGVLPLLLISSVIETWVTPLLVK